MYISIIIRKAREECRLESFDLNRITYYHSAWKKRHPSYVTNGQNLIWPCMCPHQLNVISWGMNGKL